jgi:hypothetical protein
MLTFLNVPKTLYSIARLFESLQREVYIQRVARKSGGGHHEKV